MKSQIILFAALCLSGVQAVAQNYGEFSYPHPNHLVCSGELTEIYTHGYLTGLYVATSSPGTTSFSLDKTDDNSSFAGANTFSNTYMAFGNAACVSTLPQINNCAGISAIETSPQVLSGQQVWYAMAGANSEGTFFSVMGAAGVPINSVNYIHPVTPAPPVSGVGLLKPYLIESRIQPGNFFICGEEGGRLYAMKVDVSGTILWSALYNFPYGIVHPKQIIECPYTGDLTVVGHCQYTSSTGPSRFTDGFFLKMDRNNGAVNMFKTYGMPTGACNEFYSINIAKSTLGGSNGFVIGGYTDPVVPAAAITWMLKVNPGGNIIWNRTLVGSPPVVAFLDVFERMNTAGQYEYFGAGVSMAGYSVMKLSDGGCPASSGMNQFNHDAPGSPQSQPVAMKAVLGPVPMQGYHVFGDAVQNVTGTSYQVNAYFNGVSGCQNTVNIVSCEPAPNSVIQPPFGPIAGAVITRCNNFQIRILPVNTTPTVLCNGTGAGGSNAKLATTTTADELSVYPNPAKNIAVISYSLSQQSSIDISLSDYSGRLISSIEHSNSKEPGDYKNSLDLDGLHLASGVYIIRATINNKTSMLKLIYTRE